MTVSVMMGWTWRANSFTWQEASSVWHEESSSLDPLRASTSCIYVRARERGSA